MRQRRPQRDHRPARHNVIARICSFMRAIASIGMDAPRRDHGCEAESTPIQFFTVPATEPTACWARFR